MQTSDSEENCFFRFRSSVDTKEVNRGYDGIYASIDRVRNTVITVTGADGVWYAPYYLSRHLAFRQRVSLPQMLPIHLLKEQKCIEADAALE